jgi:hypothetical protein
LAPVGLAVLAENMKPVLAHLAELRENDSYD